MDFLVGRVGLILREIAESRARRQRGARRLQLGEVRARREAVPGLETLVKFSNLRERHRDVDVLRGKPVIAVVDVQDLPIALVLPLHLVVMASDDGEDPAFEVQCVGVLVGDDRLSLGLRLQVLHQEVRTLEDIERLRDFQVDSPVLDGLVADEALHVACAARRDGRAARHVEMGELGRRPSPGRRADPEELQQRAVVVAKDIAID